MNPRDNGVKASMDGLRGTTTVGRGMTDEARGTEPSWTLCLFRPRRGVGGQAGVSLIELVVTVAVLGILTATILPLARVSIQREREIELRRSLRELRTAIDEYKKAADAGKIELKFDSEGYPPNLKVLVEGVEEVGKINHKLKFLRRIPRDPMTSSSDWGLRSYQDEPDSTTWGEQNVFDVYSKSKTKGLDGTAYYTW